MQRLLPRGLTVETMDGSAWVGLVPFFLRVGPAGRAVGALGVALRRDERPHLRPQRGRRARASGSSRSTPRASARWSWPGRRTASRTSGRDMSIERDRRADLVPLPAPLARPAGARSDVVVDIGEPFDADELTELDHFLTARWSLFSAPRSGLRHALAAARPVAAPPRRVVTLHDELVAPPACRRPTASRSSHYSPSVEVRIGWPSRIAA